MKWFVYLVALLVVIDVIFFDRYGQLWLLFNLGLFDPCVEVEGGLVCI